MKKKYFRLASIILAVIVLITLIINFGANFWLRNNLGGYIKKNSDYQIAYKSLNVDLFSGGILATGVEIENKKPADLNVIGIKGKVDTLSISRLGIYSALFKKVISSDNLLLVNPDLQIRLAKPVDDKTGKKRNPVSIENLNIQNGNIAVTRHSGQKFISVKDLALNVENIQMSEESVERMLPLIFDRYDIRGKEFFFSPTEVYAITAETITTENAKMSVRNFAVTPLISFQNFAQSYPNQKNLYRFKAVEMTFKDIVLNEKKIALSNANFDSPDLRIFTTNSKAVAKKKNFNLTVNMEDVQFKNAKISVLQPNGTPKLSAGNLNVNINKFLMNSETSKSTLPFEYADFSVAGRQISFVSENQNITLAALALNPKSADVRNIRLSPVSANRSRTVMDLDAERIQVKINELKFIEQKLKLDVGNVLVNSMKGKILTAKNQDKKKNGYSGIQFPLKIGNVALRNSNIIIDDGKSPADFRSLDANIRNIEMNSSTVKNRFPFKFGAYDVTTQHFVYNTEFYNIKGDRFKFTNKSVQMSNFAATPKLSRAQFIRRIPAEKDLFNIKVNQVSASGTWDFLSENKFMDASQVTLNGVNANIFRSKIPKNDLTEKLLYSSLLRNMKLPMYVQNLVVKNSVLEYEEDTKKSDGPGKLTFGNFNMNVKNINSGKMKGKPTQVLITINCRFMNASPMNVKWNFDVLNKTDAFSIAGNVADLPASRVNPFIEPYLKVRATGLISDLIFNFKGNYNGLGGTLNLKHQDLKVALLKEDGEKNKLLSAVANIFVRSDSGKYPESVQVENVVRDQTKSFFNMFWKGIEQGLKKTLLGNNAEKTEQTVKNTIQNTKKALEENKDGLKKSKEAVSEKVQDTKEKVSEKAKGLQNLFRKKSD